MKYDDDLKSQLAAYLITKFEGFSPIVYADAVGYKTIGYGHLLIASDKYDESTYLTEEQGRKLLQDDMAIVRKALDPFEHLNYEQYAAAASLLLNIGTRGFIGKTPGPAPTIKGLLSKLNDYMKDYYTPESINDKGYGQIWPEIFEAFCAWRRAAKKILPGLVKRRFAEALICCNRKDVLSMPSTMFRVDPLMMPIADANFDLITLRMRDEARLIAKDFLHKKQSRLEALA